MDVVRLKVNLAPDIAETLKTLGNERDDNVTETIRRAIMVLKAVTEYTSNGNSLLLQQADGTVHDINLI